MDEFSKFAEKYKPLPWTYLDNHPNDYFNYVNHKFSQLNADSDTSSVASDDSFAGGRRKKKTRKKKRRRSKKKTKKKY